MIRNAYLWQPKNLFEIFPVFMYEFQLDNTRSIIYFKQGYSFSFQLYSFNKTTLVALKFSSSGKTSAPSAVI